MEPFGSSEGSVVSTHLLIAGAARMQSMLSNAQPLMCCPRAPSAYDFCCCVEGGEAAECTEPFLCISLCYVWLCSMCYVWLLVCLV